MKRIFGMLYCAAHESDFMRERSVDQPGFVALVYEIVNVLVRQYGQFGKILDVGSVERVFPHSEVPPIFRIQQVAYPLAIDFHITDLHRVLQSLVRRVADFSKQVLANLWYYPLLTFLLLAHHSVRFTGAGLTVRKDANVIACVAKKKKKKDKMRNFVQFICLVSLLRKDIHLRKRVPTFPRRYLCKP